MRTTAMLLALITGWYTFAAAAQDLRVDQLARKAANKRTRILTGFTMCKSYHGDLMERAMCLVVALTGNPRSPSRRTYS